MPIVNADLQLYSSANVPTDDTSTAGGAVSTTSRPTLDQFSATAVAAVISDGADTRTVTVTGRLATGAVDTEALVLNGAVEVVGAKSWERVLSIVAGATSATRAVTFKQGSGGTTRGTISVNETTRHISYRQSSSTTSIRSLYEKHFWKNAHGTLTLTAAEVKLTADPSAKVKIALSAAKGDSATTTNRLTTPGLTFADDNVAQAVPTNTLAAGESIGTWIELTLAANDAALKSSFTTQLAGQTI